MSAGRVKIVYNDDGHDTYCLEGKVIDLDNNLSTTVANVEGALKARGFSTKTVPLKGPESLDEFVREIKDSSGWTIFNLCEGAFARSGYEMNVAALLELRGLAFTGSGPLTLGLSLDKGLTKDVLKSRGVPTALYQVVDAPAASLPPGMGFPLIVKPLREDASIGIDSNAVVRDTESLSRRIEFVIKGFQQPAIIEEYIEGREFNISVLGNGRSKRALPPSEIEFVDFPPGKPRICCYEAKWVEDSLFFNKTVPRCPADIPVSLKDELSSIALRAYDIMGCRDYARVDMRVGLDGRARVLEVNPNPDISADAGFARAAKAAGLDYPSLIEAIVRSAAERAVSARAAAAR